MVFLLVLPYFVFAVDPLAKLKEVGSTNGPYEDADEGKMVELIGNVISVFLSLLGVIFILLTIYAGYNWMTANGDEGKVDKAKDILWRAVIGLIITVGSYAIWNLVLLSGLL